MGPIRRNELHPEGFGHFVISERVRELREDGVVHFAVVLFVALVIASPYFVPVRWKNSIPVS